MHAALQHLDVNASTAEILAVIETDGGVIIDNAISAAAVHALLNYGLGYFSPINFSAGQPDTLPPEALFGGEMGNMNGDVPAVSTF